MNNLMHELSGDLVSFWKTQTIYAAVKLGVMDALPGSLQAVAAETLLHKANCLRLLRGLWELNLVTIENEHWDLTPKGQLLTPRTSSMAAAAEVWARSHYLQWQSLTESLQNDFIPQKNYFSSLSKDKSLLNTYQNALSGYAMNDYQAILELVSWEEHQCILDAGGGNGVLLSMLLKKYRHLEGILIELPEVIAQIKKEEVLERRIEYTGIDFFEPWNVVADGIILSRVLHDWPDYLALELLKRAKEALAPGGKMYVLEMILDQDSPKGSLLDLNMLVMTGGCERTLQDWQSLFDQANLRLSKITELSSVVSILMLEQKP